MLLELPMKTLVEVRSCGGALDMQLFRRNTRGTSGRRPFVMRLGVILTTGPGKSSDSSQLDGYARRSRPTYKVD